MKMIVLRHGETDWNKQDKVLGRTDMPLNDQGKAQALKMAEGLRDTHIDVIYTSPLRRARETAETLSGGTIPVVVADDLIEMDYGVFEGEPRKSPVYQAAKRDYFKRYPEGESYLDVAGRVLPLLKKWSVAHKDDTIAVVSHGGICRVVVNWIEDMDNEEFPSFAMPNCGWKVFELS